LVCPAKEDIAVFAVAVDFVLFLVVLRARSVDVVGR
jgi:hypothetical protein